MDWRSFVMHTYKKLKQQHPDKRVTLKDAMIAAKTPYRKMQENMFRVRGGLVEDHRRLASKMKGVHKRNHLDRAERVETTQYAGVLASMRDKGWDSDFEVERELDSSSSYSRLA
jgi:hypothetical protein